MECDCTLCVSLSQLISYVETITITGVWGRVSTSQSVSRSENVKVVCNGKMTWTYIVA